MYNGNGNRFGSGAPGNRFGIRPMYLYIGIAVLVLLAIWLISGFFRAGIEGYFSLAAGVLLVLGNLRDLIMNPYPQRSNTALINTMIGGALIFFFLGKGFGLLWFAPAVLLLLIAAPLMLGRADVYAAYMLTARNAVSGVKRTIDSVRRPY